MVELSSQIGFGQEQIAARKSEDILDVFGSAGFPTCCIADFQIGGAALWLCPLNVPVFAG
jgi:hypothetical protein